MHSQELESLINRYIPDFEKGIKGATEEEIKVLERETECRLPEFYYWFLSRMGHNMGEISFPTIDFSVTKIVQCYQGGLVNPDPRYLMIGCESKERFLNIYYDLESQHDGDAYVLRRDPVYDENHFSAETFREFLAWIVVSNFGIDKCPEICEGLFIDDDFSGGDVLMKLSPAMNALNFEEPVKTGKYRGIFVGSQSTMITHCPPGDDPGYHGFFLGGIDKKELRRVLIEIEKTTSLEIEVNENDPRRLNKH